jgi:hypothetical protein
MIYCKELDKSFDTQELMFKSIIDNKSHLMSLKKSAVKFTDGFDCLLQDEVTEKGVVTKGNEAVTDNPSELKVRVVMNTTNLMDSHLDVHIDGLWKRTLKASSSKLHLQEHKREFDKVISNETKAYVKSMTFKDLGATFDGDTQALIFDSIVKASRNELMFNQYKNGWVNNHSVGMQYVDFAICINSDERWAKEEKENWDKYYPLVANKEDADAYGYFWAILEAKLLEGSAVLFGSNYVTPTLENNLKSEQSLSDEDKNDPPQGTQPINKFFNPNLF